MNHEKQKVARTYNKIVKFKSFMEGDLVWKAIFLLGSKNSVYRIWSPSWGGPYLIIEVPNGNSNRLMHINSSEHSMAINGK